MSKKKEQANARISPGVYIDIRSYSLTIIHVQWEQARAIHTLTQDTRSCFHLSKGQTYKTLTKTCTKHLHIGVESGNKSLRDPKCRRGGILLHQLNAFDNIYFTVSIHFS